MKQNILPWTFLVVLLGIVFASGSPEAGGGWTSDEVSNEATCTYTESQFEQLLKFVQASRQQMQRLEVGNSRNNRIVLNEITSMNSSISFYDNKCDNYISKLEKGLVSIAFELYHLISQGSCTASDTDKLKNIQEKNNELRNNLKNFVRKHDQSMANLKDNFNNQIQQYKVATNNLLKKIDDQQKQVHNERIRNIVLFLKLRNVDEAVGKIQHFFDNDESRVDEIVKTSVTEVYKTEGVQHWSSLITFCYRLPTCAAPRLCYTQLLQEMSPLIEIDATILMKMAYKISKDSCRDSSIENLFPLTIRNLFWPKSFKMRNTISGHYMKVVQEDQWGHLIYHMVGEENCNGSSSWRFSPYQLTEPDGEVRFRLENVETGKHLMDTAVVGFSNSYGKADNSNAKWEVTFKNNRVRYQYSTDDFYLYSPGQNKYLYEARRNWEPWRCGFSQWLDCAVVTQQEGVMYDEGKWSIVECDQGSPNLNIGRQVKGFVESARFYLNLFEAFGLLGNSSKHNA